MRLYAFTCGHFVIRKRMFIADAEDGDTRLQIPIPVFLIMHPQGNVLFDTGLHAAGLAAPWERWGGLNKALVPLLSPDDHVLRQLARVDVKPGDVRYVINSHLHHDHSGGNAAFPKATFLIQRAEWEAIREPQLAKMVGYLPADCAMDVRYELLTGEHDIFGDGTLVLTPTSGHTPGHQSLHLTLLPLAAANRLYWRATPATYGRRCSTCAYPKWCGIRNGLCNRLPRCDICSSVLARCLFRGMIQPPGRTCVRLQPITTDHPTPPGAL